MELEALCRLDSVEVADLTRSQGVIKGLRMVRGRLEELKNSEEEE